MNHSGRREGANDRDDKESCEGDVGAMLYAVGSTAAAVRGIQAALLLVVVLAGVASISPASCVL